MMMGAFGDDDHSGDDDDDSLPADNDVDQDDNNDHCEMTTEVAALEKTRARRVAAVRKDGRAAMTMATSLRARVCRRVTTIVDPHRRALQTPKVEDFGECRQR